VLAPTNVRYLTGLSSSNAAVLVPPDGEASLYTDFRYREKAAAIAGVEFVEAPRDLIGALGTQLEGRRIAFEAPHVSYFNHRRLTEAGIDLVPVGRVSSDVKWGPVESLRAVKEPGEIEALRRASALSDEVFAALAQERFIGRTEADLAGWIDGAFRERGAPLAFPSIVAAGVNGAVPHAEPGDRTIEAGTLVTVDTGCVVDGYCSDCTRTFATGDLPQQLAEVYELCLTAQLAGLDAVKAGARAHDVDAASRVAIEEAGLGDRYGHALGHGVGLDIHESPAVRPDSEDVLVAGNVTSIEPGIYLSGVGGVRIEDLVLVTDDGAERLTVFGKELTVVQ
jgi:Xaa-Pro aminopeptidase